MSDRERCVKITLGHFNEATQRLVAWKSGWVGEGLAASKEIMLASPDLDSVLFDQCKWPDGSVEAQFVDYGGDSNPIQTNARASRGRWIFQTIGERLCYLTLDRSMGAKEAEHVELCNFCIPKMLAAYQYVEFGETPMYKFLCRRVFDEKVGGETIYIGSDDQQRTPDLTNVHVLEVEVIISPALLKSQQELKKAFNETHNSLIVDTMTIDMLCCYMNSIPWPLASAVIMRWGVQHNGYFVLSNAAFRNGMMCSVEESGHAISPAYFNKNQHYPMPSSDFPRMMIIPIPHLRYMIGLGMWDYQMPQFFQNNEMPAKATFALGVLGLHADKCWAGQAGLGHGCPVGWVWSKEMGTGAPPQ